MKGEINGCNEIGLNVKFYIEIKKKNWLYISKI